MSFIHSRVTLSAYFATILLVVSGCATQQLNSRQAIPVATAIEQAFRDRSTHSVRSATGKEYRHFDSGDAGAQRETYRRAATATEDTSALLTSKPIIPHDEDWFEGKARRQAKTTIAHAQVERFSSLEKLMGTLPPDSAMLSYQPKITRDTQRVKEEVRNVGVCAYVVATKREDDNDYHIMISNGDSLFMTVEISGIPKGESVTTQQRLLAVRRDFEGFASETSRSTSAYAGWKDPVPTYIEGSLFYDTEHKPGAVGPAFARPKSSWEIHPVTKIEFEPTHCNL